MAEHQIVELKSAEAQLKLSVVESLAELCDDRKTYGEQLRKAAKKLNCSVRTIQRLMKKWEEEGNAALLPKQRKDKGKHRISEEWQTFIVKAYGKGKRTPLQVFNQVKIKAKQERLASYPSHMTVYRVLAPLIKRQDEKTKIRNVGWKGGRLALKTREGEVLEVEYSNQVWQCDHTRADILLLDKHGYPMGRPWLTTVIDTYSRAIVGVNLGYDAPSSWLVALALRHAILPKQYGPEYKLYADWPTYGTPDHFFTDGGKDFRSNHLQQIGAQLGFTCHLRDRPSEGGIVERPFGALNTAFFATLPGYTGSNVQERPANAEKDACLTLQDLERLLVAYIVNHHNQKLDARMGNQTRIQRWEAGLVKQPHILPERDLDICLMKQTRRTIYRGGYLQFENLTYRSEELAAYAGQPVVLRYDPRNITQLRVYRPDEGGETFLGVAQAQDFEGETLALDEAKANSRQIREEGKKVSNDSMLDEIRDREAFVDQVKKTRKDRQKEEQAALKTQAPPPVEIEQEKTSDDVQSASKNVDGNTPSEPEARIEAPLPEFEVWSFDDEDE